MKPIPSEENPKESMRPIPGMPTDHSQVSYSEGNRRSASVSGQWIYPWLLFASTGVAATFCLAYITKPVIVTNNPPVVSPVALDPELKPVASSGSPKPDLPPGIILPDPDRLPGDPGLASADNPGGKPPTASHKSDFEETNIRVQHVLDAESSNGEVDRIIVDVPVLYRSRNLHWTQEETAEARKLLESLTLHQAKIRTLRDEGSDLLDSWNRLMGSSIPSDALRADSPSLPSNQFDPLAPEGAGGEETTDTIKLSRPDE